MRVTALQDRCIAKEGVVTQVRKHNAHLMNEQGQYKDDVHTLNKELKEVKEKLGEADRQSDKLKEEVTALGQRVQTAGVTRFETSRRHNRLLILVPGIMALVLTIALSRSRQPSQGWIYLGSPWMMEKTAPLTRLPLQRLMALLFLPNLLPTLQLLPL